MDNPMVHVFSEEEFKQLIKSIKINWFDVLTVVNSVFIAYMVIHGLL